MLLQKFTLAAIVAVAFTLPAMTASADTVEFDFRDDGAGDAATDLVAALDGGGIGASATIAGLTFTTVDIFAPEFADLGSTVLDGDGVAVPLLELTGTTLFASAGDGVTTNIAGNRDRIAVNNPSINNTAFDFIDTGGAVTESSDFNTGEGFTFNLSQDASIDAIEFENLNAGNIYTVSIDGGPSQTFDGLEGNITALGALGGVIATAGTSITIEVSGPLVDNRGGIESLTFHTVAVPEPSSLALLGLAGLGLVARRRR